MDQKTDRRATVDDWANALREALAELHRPMRDGTGPATTRARVMLLRYDADRRHSADRSTPGHLDITA
jgi:hypothetical protein